MGLSVLPRKALQPARLSDLIVVTLLPWLIFTLTVSLFAFAIQDFAPLVWALVVAGALLALLFIALGSASGRSVEVALGLLIFASVAVAVGIGLFIQYQYMSEYWRLVNGATYRQVSALDPSGTHGDATVLEFEPGTFVDTSRAVGYTKAGSLLCAAPISSPGTTTTPQHWAVGIDCCGLRGSFTCDDVGNTKARSGILVDDSDGAFARAVRMAESVNEIQPGLNPPLLVKWTVRPDDLLAALWSSAMALLAAASVLQLLVLSCTGHVLSRSLLG